MIDSTSTKMTLPWFGLICINAFGLYIAMSAVMTGYLAAALNYDPALGAPLFRSFYHPLAWLIWTDSFAADRPAVFGLAFAVFYGVLLLIAAGGYMRYESLYRVSQVASTVYGSARFANDEEIKQAGLFAKSGIVVGQIQIGKKTTILCSDSDEHVAVVAPTRAGKGVGVVIPTLLTWNQAAIIYDQKGELWALTSGWRAANVGPVYRFAPADRNNRFKNNPVGEVRFGTEHEIGDAQNLGLILADPSGKGLDDHWGTNAMTLLAVIVLFVCYDCQKKNEIPTLGHVRRTLSNPDLSKKELLTYMKHNLLNDGKPHQMIAEMGQRFGTTPDRELGSIWSTAETALNLYHDPIVLKSLSGETVSFVDVVSSDKPITIYLVTGEEDKERLRPYVRLFFTQMIRCLLRATPNFSEPGKSAYKFKLLVLLDEFISLGKIEFIQEALSYVAGYGIRVMTIIQDTAQLTAVYGKDETIMANSNLKVVFPPGRIETAEWLCKLLGSYTLQTKQASGPGSISSIGKKGWSNSYGQQERKLKTPDEIMLLRSLTVTDNGQATRGQAIIVRASTRPILAEQASYFLDQDMALRASIPPVDNS